MQTYRDRRTLTRSTVRNAIALSAVGLLAKASGLAVTVLIARFLGPEGLGLFALLFTATMLLEELSLFGLSDLVLRQASAHPESSASYWRAGLRSSFVTSMVTTAGLAVAAALAHDKPEMRDSLLLIAVSTPLAAAAGIGQSILQSRRDVVFVALANLVAMTASLVLLVTLLQGGMGVRSAFLSRVVFTGGLVIATVFRIRAHDGTGAARTPIEPLLLLRALPFAMNRALNEVGLRVSLIVVSATSALAQVGIFDAGDRLSLSLRAIAGSGITALVPVFSRSVALNDADKDQLIAYSTKYVGLLVSGVAFVVGVFAGHLTSLLFGPGFSETAALLPSLLLAQALATADVVVRQALIAHGREYYVIGSAVLTLLVRVGLIALLSVHFGLPGAAFGVLISTVLAFAVSMLVARHSGMSLNASRLILRPSICVLAAFAMLWVLKGQSELLVLAAGATAFLAAAALLRVFPPEERRFLREAIQHRGRKL